VRGRCRESRGRRGGTFAARRRGRGCGGGTFALLPLGGRAGSGGLAAVRFARVCPVVVVIVAIAGCARIFPPALPFRDGLDDLDGDDPRAAGTVFDVVFGAREGIGAVLGPVELVVQSPSCVDGIGAEKRVCGRGEGRFVAGGGGSVGYGRSGGRDGAVSEDGGGVDDGRRVEGEVDLVLQTREK